MQLWRQRRRPVAHQRRLRHRLTRTDPRPSATSLDGYTVALIPRHDAAPLIRRYEWLGTMGRASIFVGLVSPAGETEGVAAFGYGPGGPIRNIIGGPALCLKRGCCVHYAPPNAASFLISHAVKLVRDLFGVDRFFAYADPEAGEYGAVYQAANWHYLGQGLNGKRGYRRRRQYVLPPGHNPRKANWRSDRDLRRQGRRLTVTQARAQGWKIETRAAKHVYAVCLGRNRAAWRESLPSRPYPKPRPALKGQGPSPAIGGARDQSLPVAVVGFLGRTCTCAPRKKSQLRYRESPEAKGPDAHHRSVSRK